MERKSLLGLVRPANPEDDDDAVPASILAEGGAVKRGAAGQAERAVVGAILQDNELFDVVANLIYTDEFADPAAKAAFGVIADIIEGRVEGVSVADAISVGSTPSLAQLAPIPELEKWCAAVVATEAVVSSHARVVQDAANERALNATVQRASEIAAGSGRIAERSTEVRAMLDEVAEVRSLPVNSLGAISVGVLSRMAANAEAGVSNFGLTYGIDELDALTSGMRGGQLIVLGARPGQGKTALALCIGIASAKAGNAMTMVSMEMKKEELAKRALAIESQVNGHAIRIGALTADDWEDAVAASERLVAIPFEVVDAAGVTLAALGSTARRLKREGKLQALIVDYLQLMKAVSGKNSTRENDVSALSRGLKELAMALDVPVIALSQLKRSPDPRMVVRPVLEDLRESGALEQDADVVLFIHRDQNETTLIVAKQRDGPIGDVPLEYLEHCTKFVGKKSPTSQDPFLAAA